MYYVRLDDDKYPHEFRSRKFMIEWLGKFLKQETKAMALREISIIIKLVR